MTGPPATPDSNAAGTPPAAGLTRFARVAVIAGALALTGVLGWLAATIGAAERRTELESAAQVIADDLRTEANAYLQFARATEAFASIQEDMIPLEFEQFVTPMIQERPAIKTVEVAERASTNQRHDIVDRMRRNGFADFTLDASTATEEESVVVTHVKPISPETVPRLGRSAYDDPESRMAVNRVMSRPSAPVVTRQGSELRVFVGMTDRPSQTAFTASVTRQSVRSALHPAEEWQAPGPRSTGVVIFRIDLNTMIASNIPAWAATSLAAPAESERPGIVRHDLQISDHTIPVYIDPGIDSRSFGGQLRLLLAIGLGLAIGGLGYVLLDRTIRHGETAEQKRRAIEGVVMARTAQLRVKTRELTRARDRAEAGIKAKEAFLTVMGHEIRTPLNSIVGFCDLLDDEDATPAEMSERRETVQRNGRQLANLITDILEYSNLGSGLATVQVTPVDSCTYLTDMVDALRREVQPKGLAFNVSVTPTLPSTLRFEPNRVQNALTELITNAVKFTDVGSVELVIAYRPASIDTLVLTVQDTGSGVSADDVDSIFEPFTQLDCGMNRRHGGTGLGLALARRLAESLGGTLEYLPTPAGAQGARFELSIPIETLDATPIGDAAERIARGQHAARAKNADRSIPTPTAGAAAGAGTGDAPAPPASTPLDGHRILVAEDGPDNRRLIGFILKKAGADVELVENGQLALSRILDPDAPAIDLVVSDMQMPVMDGYASVAAMRANGLRTPVIALTAHAMESDRARCLQAGCDDYLTKPVNRTQLVDRCEHWITTSPSEQAA
ncbi:MAG: response regulator [Phycisphaerales bacterium]